MKQILRQFRSSPKLLGNPHSTELVNFPSLVAQRLWYYVRSVGEANWPRGVRLSHPMSDCGEKDTEGFVLHFILDGELTHRMKDKAFVVRTNEAVLFDLAKPVSYWNDSPQVARFYWVKFDGRGMKEVFDELDARAQPVFQGLSRQRIVAQCCELAKVIGSDPPWQEAMVSALVAEVLAELFMVRAKKAPKVSAQLQYAHASLPVRQVLACITRRYYQPWTVKELAHWAGLSIYHLSRVFKKETGYSPKQFLNRYRVEHSKALLLETRLSVAEVAREVGFHNPVYFARLFRQINGVSPREYRARATRRAAGK